MADNPEFVNDPKGDCRTSLRYSGCLGLAAPENPPLPKTRQRSLEGELIQERSNVGRKGVPSLDSLRI